MFLSVVAIVATTGISIAQSFSNTPNDTINIVGMMEDLQTLSIQQINISPNTITLKWKKVSESVPLFWDASVCDNQICNTSLVDSGMMNPITPADFGLLLLHITAHVNYGNATVRYAVWDSANPEIKDTLTYILTINPTLGVGETPNKNDFLLFPNPAKEFINIIFENDKLHQFEIYNSVGEKVFSGISYSNYTLPIADWNSGVYNVSVFTHNKIFYTKKILIQK